MAHSQVLTTEDDGWMMEFQTDSEISYIDASGWNASEHDFRWFEQVCVEKTAFPASELI